MVVNKELLKQDEILQQKLDTFYTENSPIPSEESQIQVMTTLLKLYCELITVSATLSQPEPLLKGTFFYQSLSVVRHVFTDTGSCKATHPKQLF